jgi:hypothetical protein
LEGTSSQGAVFLDRDEGRMFIGLQVDVGGLGDAYRFVRPSSDESE